VLLATTLAQQLGAAAPNEFLPGLCSNDPTAAVRREPLGLPGAHLGRLLPGQLPRCPWLGPPVARAGLL
jgi:hypothetical protein